jgi:hypothetical protein
MATNLGRGEPRALHDDESRRLAAGTLSAVGATPRTWKQAIMASMGKPTRNDLRLIVAAAAIAVGLAVVGRVLRPTPPRPPSELDLLPLDDGSRHAVERALLLKGIDADGYDALFDPMRASGLPLPPNVHEVHLMTKGCSHYRGNHPGCLLWIVTVNQETHEASIALDPGGK